MDDSTPPERPTRLTATAAAIRAGVSRTTLYTWTRDGKIPVHRSPSGRPWYDPAELDAAFHQPPQDASTWRTTEYQCAVCGRAFLPSRRTQQYDTPTCRRKAKRDRLVARRTQQSDGSTT
jgi:DNA-directed RNA polymerase subunit RPC12/RpoP